MRDEFVNDYIRRFRDTKNRCFNVNLAEMDLADLAFNSLRSHIKEKLEGNHFFTVNQVRQRALAAESQSKELQESHRHHRPNTHAIEYQSDFSDDESKEVYAAEFVKFDGDDSKRTFEYVSQYLAQLGESSSINELKVCLFSLSLTGTAFSWFSFFGS